jgi:aspartate/methionine/tyrosine aminotransferase
MMELSQAIPEVVHLEVGDPDFTTPDHIIQAAATEAARGFTKYTPSAGFMSLRELIAEKLAARNKLDVDPSRVIVSVGAAGGLFTSLLAILDPGDEVLVPDPGFAGYPAQVHVQRAISRHYPLLPSSGFAPDLDALEANVSNRTKAIVVNSPGNPTGAVYDTRIFQTIVDIADRHDLWVISDECYDEMVFGRAMASTAISDTMGRVISVFSFSKTYAMTGWRVGYVVAPAAIADTIVKLQESVYACASSVSQKAAEAALTGPQHVVAGMRDAYRGRRDLAVGILEEMGIGYVRPEGAFYLMVDISPGGASAEFAERLLVDKHVAVVPGIAFGPHGEGFVRISLASSPEAIETGLRRLGAMLSPVPASAGKPSGGG